MTTWTTKKREERGGLMGKKRGVGCVVVSRQKEKEKNLRVRCAVA